MIKSGRITIPSKDLSLSSNYSVTGRPKVGFEVLAVKDRDIKYIYENVVQCRRSRRNGRQDDKNRTGLHQRQKTDWATVDSWNPNLLRLGSFEVSSLIT